MIHVLMGLWVCCYKNYEFEFPFSEFISNLTRAHTIAEPVSKGWNYVFYRFKIGM